MLSKEALIKKLEEISTLHHKVLFIKQKINDYEPEDKYERKVKVLEFPFEIKNEYDEKIYDVIFNDIEHADDDAVEKMSKCYDTAYHPKKPVEFKKPPFTGGNTKASIEKQKKLQLISNIGLGVAIFFLVGAIVGTSGTPESLPAIIIIALLGAAAFVGGRYLGKKEKEVENRLNAEAKVEYDRNIAVLEQQYNNTIRLYEEECNKYLLIREAFLKEYADWRDVYIESLKEEKIIGEKLEADRLVAVQKIEDEELMPTLESLAETNDILSTEYLSSVDIITDLLKSGRADDLKEAINLYEDILYRERQLQLAREKEAQRQREEEMKREAQERHHAEQMAMQKEQFARQEEQARKQFELQERQHQEEMRMREQQERARQREEQSRLDGERRKREREELDRKRQEDAATVRQCNTCALCGNCSMAFRRPNCASYRPR